MKGKRGVNWDMFLFYAVLMLIVVLVIFGGRIVDEYNDWHLNQCAHMDQVDYVMAGFEGHLDQRVESDALNRVLIELDMDRVFSPPSGDLQRPLELAMYDARGILGTILVIHSDIDQQWYMQVNDGLRNDCGLYVVDWDVVNRIAELLY